MFQLVNEGLSVYLSWFTLSGPLYNIRMKVANPKVDINVKVIMLRWEEDGIV